jgi:TPR repeat protein
MSRPRSYVESLANVPYNEQIAPGAALNNAGLQSVVGSAASLLDTKTTLGLYRANVKKTQDAAVQYEFAIFMINAARDVMPEDDVDPNELTNEAKQILHRLADRAYPFAQYYMGDGYFSGLFNKGKPDYDKAFPLFVAASKHGHAEAGYRAALCYEFGWGTAKSYPKALQFYKSSASKNHPGAATRLGLASIRGDMGLDSKVRKTYREGFKWLKRAAESADPQYNAGPFELGLLHLAGHGDDIFKDEAYAMQLITQAADLGHVQANFMLGQVYESGLHGCPKDAALSVHFYNGAATRGHVEGMMALCAWYMVGAEPVLERDEAEAYAWAKMAADLGQLIRDAFALHPRANTPFRLRQSRIRHRLLHRNGHWMSPRSIGSQRAILPGRRVGEQDRATAIRNHSGGSERRSWDPHGQGRSEEQGSGVIKGGEEEVYEDILMDNETIGVAHHRLGTTYRSPYVARHCPPRNNYGEMVYPSCDSDRPYNQAIGSISVRKSFRATSCRGDGD